MRERLEIRILTIAALGLLPPAGTASAYTLTTLHDFCGEANCQDGNFPDARLLADRSGNLYGTATSGGKYNGGVVFRYQRNTATYSVIHNFCAKANCVDGQNPTKAELVIDTNGVIYGTTYWGGANGFGGTLFELSP